MGDDRVTAADRAQFERDDEAEAKALARAAEWDDPTDCD
jgi:hypothetical protein